jgi:hypothetical protein
LVLIQVSFSADPVHYYKSLYEFDEAKNSSGVLGMLKEDHHERNISLAPENGIKAFLLFLFLPLSLEEFFPFFFCHRAGRGMGFLDMFFAQDGQFPDGIRLGAGVNAQNCAIRLAGE